MTYATSAPLLSSIRDKGATFYTISTALSDIDKTTMDSNYMMAPSKFVCLNLPTWGRTANIQSLFEEPENIGEPLTTDPNLIVPKLIQNYIENAIAVTLPERTDNTLQSISESLVWKLLKRLGGLKMIQSDDIIINGDTIPTFKEDLDAFSGEYKQIVVYSGEINVLNHITKQGQSYTEVFMHVPTQSHLLENLRFIDSQYGLRLEELPEYGGPDYTVGLEDHPLSNTKAVYDTIDKKYSFIPEDRLGIYFDELETQVDDVNKQGQDFEFNAVLVYYDIWNKDVPADRATNLYGILFLDKFVDNGAGTYSIQTLDKYVADSVTTGNGFAIRLNLKTTSNQLQTSSEVSINDYNSVSMELYMSALQKINNITDLYENSLNKFSEINDKYNTILQLLPQLEQYSTLNTQVSELTRLVESNQITYRISNEDLFEVFNNAVTATSSTTKNVNVQMVVGNYIYDPGNGDIMVLDPNGDHWKWDTETSTWIKTL